MPSWQKGTRTHLQGFFVTVIRVEMDVEALVCRCKLRVLEASCELLRDGVASRIPVATRTPVKTRDALIVELR